MPPQDFASLMEASLQSESSRTRRRLNAGDTVEGTVIQIGPEHVFVDIGTPKDARINRSELCDAKGQPIVKVGDRLRARVVDASPDGPRLAIALGRSGAALDTAALELAKESGAPVEGHVAKVVKGGLQVEVGGVRAFCPASQVDVSYVQDLAVFEGQTLAFKVTEIREGGRSVVLSRRALLEQERREREQQALSSLTPGTVTEGNVVGIHKHGAIVDLSGVEGFVHISELAPHRVERVEDVVRVGERVQVRVLAIEETEKGRRIRLSMKSESSVQAAAPSVDEVLDGTVARVAQFGVFVTTAKGEGLVPLSELGLPPGSDHRRVFPPGTPVRVVLLSRDSQNGRLRFSATKVAAVEERKNYQEFATGSAGSSQGGGSSGLGSLGELLRQKLGPAITGAGTGGATPAPSGKAGAKGGGAPAGKRRG